MFAFGLIVANGAANRSQLRDGHRVTLPSYTVLDEHVAPVIASSGKVGFISSVTEGSLMSFSLGSGKIISSVVVGENAGPISLVEVGGRRLIAVPTANRPGETPATISIIDATKARRLELHSLLVLPLEAGITVRTRALLTSDARYCLIASTFDEPALFSFSVESGEVSSRVPLPGRPSNMTLFERDGRRLIALASAASNIVSLITVGEDGVLTPVSYFLPAGETIDAANNPAFSEDGRYVFIGAAGSDKLLAIDASKGVEAGSISINNPLSLTVARDGEGRDIIGVTRGPRQPDESGGVSVLSFANGQMAIRAEFTPPNQIEFSRTNNVQLDVEDSLGFVGSSSGLLFAFDLETGELDSYQDLGRELRTLALGPDRTLTAVRSASNGDEIVIIKFDVGNAAPADPPGDVVRPVISALSPSAIEMGQTTNPVVFVFGENFRDGSRIKFDGIRIQASLSHGGKALRATLPAAWFTKRRDIAVQVELPGGTESVSAALHVIPPFQPTIESITPSRIKSTSSPFTLRIKGRDFRASSVIHVDGRPLDTERTGERLLSARVPIELIGGPGPHKVQVVDAAVPDLASNEEALAVRALRAIRVETPSITSLRASRAVLVAGDGSFKLRIYGNGFGPDATVEINGAPVEQRRTKWISDSLVKVRVQSYFIEDPGRLSVSVRNPGGNTGQGLASNRAILEVRAPQIVAVLPGEVVAGSEGASLTISGTNLRRSTEIFVKDASDPTGTSLVKLPARRVRFRSPTRMVARLSAEEKSLFARPGAINVGVGGSRGTVVQVAGPEISEAVIRRSGANADRRIVVIRGRHFHRGSVVELFSGDQPTARLRPWFSSGRLIKASLRRKLEGEVTVRVVNAPGVESQATAPRRLD
jgi:IPT/TIG domain